MTSAEPRRAVLRRELTAEQHALIRRHLAMIPVYIWVVYSWVHVLVRIPLDEPVRDFAHFYTQGVIAREHDAASLYDIDRMADVAQRVLPGHQRVLYPPVYGPQMSVLFRPLAMLPYVPARHVWLAITVLVYGLCMYAIWRTCPRLADKPGTTALLLLAAPALHYVAGFLQVSVIGLVCVTVGYLALRANRPFLAGLGFGLLAYKPPLAFGVGVVLAASLLVRLKLVKVRLKPDPTYGGLSAGDHRQIAAGAIVAAIAQLAIGTLYWGPSILPAYFAALTRLPEVTNAMEPNKYHMHSWRTFFDLLGLPATISFGAYVVMSAITLAGAVLCWIRPGPLALRFAALMIATVLVDPHLYAYDLVLLIPAFLVMWDWVLGEPDRRLRTYSFNAAFVWLLYICYLSPLFVTLADVGRIQLSPLLLGLLGVVILGVLRTPGSPPPPSGREDAEKDQPQSHRDTEGRAVEDSAGPACGAGPAGQSDRIRTRAPIAFRERSCSGPTPIGRAASRRPAESRARPSLAHCRDDLKTSVTLCLCGQFSP